MNRLGQSTGRRHWQLGCAWLLAGVLSVPLAAGAAGYLYRYVNDKGMTVIGHSIPSEFVDNGYEILHKDFTVYKVVERALTPEELANRSEEEKAAAAAAAEVERLKRWDESLLLRYSSVEDIEAARERGLRELQIRISILKGNVHSLKAQVESNQAKAADIERSGSAVPEEILTTIDALRYEISEAEKNIGERTQEKELVDAGFQRDIERFELLLDKVQMRQRYSRSALEAGLQPE